MRRTVPFLASLALLAPSGAALAQDNPLGPLPQGPSSPTPTVVAPKNSSDGGGGLETWQELLIFAAGVVLLAGIGFAIVSDARRRAPVKDSELAHPGAGPVKRNRSQKQRERARAKARSGRAQRKRNRRR